jgi:hypothetical protein
MPVDMLDKRSGPSPAPLDSKDNASCSKVCNSNFFIELIDALLEKIKIPACTH